MTEAISLCEGLVGNIRRTSMGKSKLDNENATRKVLFLQELMKREDHKITRTQLNKKYWMHSNMEGWDDVARSFEAAGTITIETAGPHTIFKMTEKAYQDMKRYLEGKNK